MAGKNYLKTLAGTCGHIASFEPCEIEEELGHPYSGASLRILWAEEENLQIHVLSDYNVTEGRVISGGKKVFSYSESWEEEWQGREPCEDMSEDWNENDWAETYSFNVETYIPGIWEKQINKLCEKTRN